MRRLTLLTLMVALTACGGTATTDAGTDSGNGGTDGGGGGTDGGGGDTDGGPAPALPTLMAYDGTNLIAADLSCLGTRMAPTGSAAADTPVRTVARGLMYEPAPNSTFRIFTDNTIPADGSCGATCIEDTTDAMGEASAMLSADSWVAYRTLENTAAGTIETFQVNKEVSLSRYESTATEAFELSAIVGSLFTSALMAGRVTRQAGTVALTGTAYDCAGNELVGAELRAFNAAGEIVGGTALTGVRYIYWPDSGPLPAGNRTFTSNQGRFAGGNIPAGGPIRLELWAVRTDGANPTPIACEQIPGFEDSVVIIDLEPTRADGPSGCSTAP